MSEPRGPGDSPDSNRARQSAASTEPSNHQETTEPSSELLAIFPLASVVLFPRFEVPFYIFEPRYRAMTEAVLEGNRRIGMVVVPPEHKAEMAGDPEVYPIGCVGDLASCGKRPDGTYDIVLHGVQRFLILDEPSRPADRLYRVANVRALDDTPPEGSSEEIKLLRNEVDASCRELLSTISPDLVRQFSAEVTDRLDDEIFVNAISLSLDFSTPEKQSLLEASSILHRYEALRTLIQFRLAETMSGGAPSPSSIQ